MMIKRWLAGAVMLAVAALPAASGAVAGDLGPDNTQKHVSSVTVADDAAMQQDGQPGVAARRSALADAPRDAVSGLPTGQRQVAPVVLAALPRPAQPPIIRDGSHIVLTVFFGAFTRSGNLEPCPCDNPVCKPGCRTTLVGDPDDGGEISFIPILAPAPPGTPIVRG